MTLTRSLVEGNTSGLSFLGRFADVRDSRIVGNQQVASGMAVAFQESEGRIINTIIAGNSATAIAVQNGSKVGVWNSTVAYNGTWPRSAIACDERGSEVRTVNSIVWGNIRDEVCGALDASLVGEDPEFVREPNFDFQRIRVFDFGRYDSHVPDFVVDEGDLRRSCRLPGDGRRVYPGAPRRDPAGFGRPCGDAVDLGAFESGECEPESVIAFHRGDVNVDTRVDISDALFTLDWLFRGGPQPECVRSADVDDGGRVDLSDAVLLLVMRDGIEKSFNGVSSRLQIAGIGIGDVAQVVVVLDIFQQLTQRLSTVKCHARSRLFEGTDQLSSSLSRQR